MYITCKSLSANRTRQTLTKGIRLLTFCEIYKRPRTELWVPPDVSRSIRINEQIDSRWGMHESAFGHVLEEDLGLGGLCWAGTGERQGEKAGTLRDELETAL